MKKIKEILREGTVLGSSVQVRGIIKELSKRKTKAGKTFLSGVLADAGGQISFNLWEKADQAFDNGFVSGALIKANASVGAYQGKRQLSITTFALVREEETEAIKDSIIPASPYTLASLLGKVEVLVNQAHESDERYPDYEAFVEIMKEEGLYDKFISAPASVRVHQGYRRGLLEHSVFVANSASVLGQAYQLSDALLIYGGLLHDIGKIDQYLYTDMPGSTDRGIAYDHSIDGILSGHLVQGALLIKKHLSKHLPLDIVERLAHVALSHHNVKEWGSPVGPAFAEAYVIYLADMANAHVPLYKEVTENPAGNVVGVRQYMLDNAYVLTKEGGQAVNDLVIEEETGEEDGST